MLRNGERIVPGTVKWPNCLLYQRDPVFTHGGRVEPLLVIRGDVVNLIRDFDFAAVEILAGCTTASLVSESVAI
jgi:hypothetical protein